MYKVGLFLPVKSGTPPKKQLPVPLTTGFPVQQSTFWTEYE